MIYFDDLAVSEDVKEALSELKIEYVFQPIFYPDGKTVYAREALMRPIGRTVIDLIEEYTKLDKLHVLEVATFFGAAQAYYLRGYSEKLSINSFPCEVFTKEETQAIVDYYGNEEGLLIIELLEYPEFSLDKSLAKRNHATIGKSQIALDDYGSGFNDMDKVDLLNPEIIKIDRALLTDIDKNIEKQQNCKDIIDRMHSYGSKVVAEGVETVEEFNCLVGLGADYFQGYYLARPA